MRLQALRVGFSGGIHTGAARLGLLLLLAGLAACTSPPKPTPSVVQQPLPAPQELVAPAPPAQPVQPVQEAAPLPAPAPVLVAPPALPEPLGPVAQADTPLAYRHEGAHHLYGRYEGRIFKGKMPPLLYAVGVLNVYIDGLGSVRRLEWLREPKHAPEVVAEIERIVREAAPFPAPVRMGGVIYTDVWLWDRSGRFQLDTLTEGQLSALPASATSAVKPVAAPPPSPSVRQPPRARSAAGSRTR